MQNVLVNNPSTQVTIVQAMPPVVPITNYTSIVNIGNPISTTQDQSRNMAPPTYAYDQG